MDMTSAAKVVLLIAIVATGCGRTREVARDAAVTTFRVIDAPANYVRRKIDGEEGGTTTTTTTTTDTTVASIPCPAMALKPVAWASVSPRSSAPRTIASPSGC